MNSEQKYPIRTREDVERLVLAVRENAEKLLANYERGESGAAEWPDFFPVDFRPTDLIDADSTVSESELLSIFAAVISKGLTPDQAVFLTPEAAKFEDDFFKLIVEFAPEGVFLAKTRKAKLCSPQ